MNNARIAIPCTIGIILLLLLSNYYSLWYFITIEDVSSEATKTTTTARNAIVKQEQHLGEKSYRVTPTSRNNLTTASQSLTPRARTATPPTVLTSNHDHDLVKVIHNQQDCSKINDNDHSKNTMSCPCGSLTSPDYAQNMVDHYYHHDDQYDTIQDNVNLDQQHSMLKKCLSLKLPFTYESTPLECWPRIYLQVSFPTSGCELSRYLTTIATKRNMNLSTYNEDSKAPLYYVDIAKGIIGRDVKARCLKEHEFDFPDETTLPISIMGKASIYKTHAPKGWNYGFRHDIILPQNHEVGGQFVHGVIHLFRNPGDQIFRNKVRWPKVCERKTKNERCMKKAAKLFCSKAMEGIKDWMNWHEYWFKMTKKRNITQFLFPYEHFSDLKYSRIVTENLMNYLNETSLLQDGEIEKIVREPSYEYGSIFAKYCGRDLAVKMHEKTKSMTKVMGYEFDYDHGTWSLPAPALL